MYNIYYFIFEFGALATFFFILRRENKNTRYSETLILAFAYGLLLEIINTRLSGSYSYSNDFIFQAYGIPFAIAAGWAIVYYTSGQIAKYYELRWYQSPFFMAFLAVIFDMMLDPIAVRLGFWSWKIPLDQEWFGVPYDNLVGWLAVVWTFAFFVNLSERQFFKEKISKLMKYAIVMVSPVLLGVQITIFVTLSAIFSGRFTFGEILKFYQNWDFSYAYVPEVQAWKSYLFAPIFVVLAAYSIRSVILQKRLLRKRWKKNIIKI